MAESTQTLERIARTLHRIGPGLLQNGLPDFVREQGFTRAAVVTNETLAPLYGDALAGRLPGGFLVSVSDGERHKTLDTVRAIYDALIEHGADRSTAVVALGGGVIGDMAGFAAATFMRGLPLIQAPTSLLAMADASIGGKVGVNLPQGKNLVGAFKQPLAIFADTDTLATLPLVEFRCGLTEIVKAALIGDPDLLAYLEQRGAEPVGEIVQRAVDVKLKVVEQDPYESGVRAVLNLGHTFAHGIEQASGYTVRHGEAVAIGLAGAARLSARLDTCPASLPDRVEAILNQLGLPMGYRDLDPAAIWEAMRLDKKWRDGRGRFVLLEAVGVPIIRDGLPQSAIMPVLESLREDAT